ncbi:MAG: hypothetical protein RIQ59_1280 [Bacteroidota bacterium]|jgi:hypothetical protein
MMKKITFTLVIALFFILFLELFLRLIGFTPIEFNQKVVSKPEIPYTADSLGITLKRGTYKININDHVYYKATHNIERRRVTSKVPVHSLNKIIILGCSFAYGVGVNDEESFPFLLQTYLKEYEVENYSVPGSATIQSYLNLKKCLLKGDRPTIVVLSYAAFHEERNQLTRGFESNLFDGLKLHEGLALSKYFYPRCKIVNNNIAIEYIEITKDFTPIPFKENFAIASFIDQMWNKIDDRKTTGFPVSKILFQDFQELANQYHFKLIIADVSQSNKFEDIKYFCVKRNINYVNISPDFSLGNYTLAPYDYHPNKMAHKVYALKLYEYINNLK